MSFKIRPQVSLHKTLLMMFPLGTWDRYEFLKICKELEIEMTEIHDHLNQISYKFSNVEDYEKVYNTIYGPDNDHRWDK